MSTTQLNSRVFNQLRRVRDAAVHAILGSDEILARGQGFLGAPQGPSELPCRTYEELTLRMSLNLGTVSQAKRRR